MATANQTSAMRFSWAAAWTTFLVATFFGAVGFFLSRDIPSVARHGPPKEWRYALHIFGGSLVMLVAPFQFIAPIRNRFRRYHRWAGYTFVAASLLTFAGYWLIQPTERDTFFLSQTTAICLWMVAMMAAVIAARRKRFLTHQHNMTRAFVIAFYFVLVRLIDPWGMALITPFASEPAAANAHSDWIAWVLPLVLVEVYYGRRWDRLLKKRERSP
jgi:hypothetical protein